MSTHPVQLFVGDGLTEQVLERAAHRVADGVNSGTRFEQRATRDALAVIVEAVRCLVRGDVPRDLLQYSWTPEAPALLTALRRELLASAQPGDANNELVSMLRAIEQLALKLEDDAAVRFTNQFAGADALRLLVEVAHDMASPLSAILFLVERLQRSSIAAASGAHERQLALVYSAAFGLSSMASDVMELARGGARLTDEAPRRFAVSEVLRGVRDLVQPLAEERKLSVRFSGPPVDWRVGQPAALTRVLLNLTTNAFKFTTVGSVTVLVEQMADANTLSFTVQDSGRGIPEAELANIFSAFTQRESSQSLAFSSAGLGLAICHKLVAAMGGALHVQSVVNHGTRFTFELVLPVA